MIRHWGMAIAMVAALGIAAPQAKAVDFEVQTVFEDAMYGAAIGAAVGLGAMLLTDTPTDNWDFVLRGTGIGILGGAAYGAYVSTRAVAQIENGKVKVAMPTPQFRRSPSNPNALAMQVNLISSNF
ncbi:MAG: hypothetical protein R8K46_00810 [Mariprofundaceae bacterium]